MKVYLSGGMEHAAGEGADWRKEMTAWLAHNLGHDVVDPVVESAKISVWLFSLRSFLAQL